MQELFDLFESMGYPYFRQGSLSDDEYPNSFFTFWNYSTPTLRHRDDESKEYSYNIMVYFYTNNPRLVYEVMDEFIALAKQRGFVIEGKSYDTPSDKDNFYGRLVHTRIVKEEN